MLNKEEFKKMMTKLREADEADDAIGEAFSKSGGNYFNESFCYTQDVAVYALEAALGDDDETISYYIYDLNWGEKGKDCITLPDDTKVSLTNLDELYDYIVGKNKPPEHDTEVVFSIPSEDVPTVNALELIHDKTDDCYILDFEELCQNDSAQRLDHLERLALKLLDFSRDEEFTADDVINMMFDPGRLFKSVREAALWMMLHYVGADLLISGLRQLKGGE